MIFIPSKYYIQYLQTPIKVLIFIYKRVELRYEFPTSRSPQCEKTKNVSIFKKLIKEEKAPHLCHVAASDLNLWMVDFLCISSEQNWCMLILMPIQSYHHLARN